MKFFADKKREEREFQVGEMVYLKLQPFRQNSVSLRKNLKLSFRFYGPFKILERVGNVAYKLELPASSRIHPVFHVSLLKKCVGKDVIPVSELPETDSAGVFLIAPIAIRDTRSVNRKGVEVPQVLVHWSPASSDFVSWEDLKYIKKKFSFFDPCGQGFAHGGGIVMAGGVKKIDGASEEKKMDWELGIVHNFGKGRKGNSSPRGKHLE